jgi:hypothetical protein
MEEMGHMRTKTMWLGWLLAAGMAWSPAGGHAQDPSPPSGAGATPFAPTEAPAAGSATAATALAPLYGGDFLPEKLAPLVARGQDYAPPDCPLPLPLYSTNPAAGGFYIAGEWVMFRQTNPLHSQTVAYRGFVDTDGTVTNLPGTFVGSGFPALNVNQVEGPRSFEPGFKVTGGWRFADGSLIEVDYMHIINVNYTAEAGIIPPAFQVGLFQENTFLFAPVYNFPTLYAGAPNKIPVPLPTPGSPTIGFPIVSPPGGPMPLYGIWNGATTMQLLFTQWADQYQATYRWSLYENECWRTYGLVGPRAFTIWERFRWRTVDTDDAGNESPLWAAIYNNITSNRMYGVHAGVGNEFWLGHGFSISLDLQAAVFCDVVKEEADYELGLKFFTEAKKSKHDYTFVPELEGQLNIWWYPTEGIEIRVGYSMMGFFNTVASKQPIDFNFGGLNPTWDEGVFRFFDGINAGISFIF